MNPAKRFTGSIRARYSSSSSWDIPYENTVEASPSQILLKLFFLHPFYIKHIHFKFFAPHISDKLYDISSGSIFEPSAILKLIKAESWDFIFRIYRSNGVKICYQNNCEKIRNLTFCVLKLAFFSKFNTFLRKKMVYLKLSSIISYRCMR